MKSMDITDFKDTYQGNDYDYVEYAWNCCGDEKTVFVRKMLPFTDRCQIVMDISSMVFRHKEDGGSIYAPYIRQFACCYSVISYFTNIQLPKDPNEAMLFIEQSNIMSVIADVVLNDYIDQIMFEADKLIKYQVEKSIGGNPNNSLIQKIGSILDVFSDKLQELNVDDFLDMVLRESSISSDAHDAIVGTTASTEKD